MHSADKVRGRTRRMSLAVVSDGFDRAILEGFVALLQLFLVLRLLVADVVVLFVGHPEIVRRCVRADGAEDALTW